MKILAAHDGSKQGEWAVEWLGHLPLVHPSNFTVLHVVDVDSVRAPFMVVPVVVGNERFVREEIERLRKLANRIVSETRQSLLRMNLKGTVITKRGSIAKGNS